MISGLLQILLVVLVLFVIWYIVRIAAQQFGAPEFVVQVVGLILMLVLVIYLLQLAGVHTAWHP